MPLHIAQIPFLIKQQAFALNQRHNLLQDIISRHIDLINQDPIAIS